MIVRLALSRLALIGVLAPIVAAGCSSEKSRNPLSPNVAGPIAGVTISTPKTLQPSNGSELTVGSNIDLLIENATTNGERPLWQHVEVALDSAFASKVHTNEKLALGPNGQTSYRVPAGLSGGRTYYWRVRALDGANTGSFSNGAMFKLVIPVVIEPPVPMSPVGDATTTTRSPALVLRNTAITGPAGAVTYYFQLATDAGFANVVFNGSAPRTGGESTSLQLPELAAGARYFWRAYGSDGSNHSTWGPLQAFQTPAPPAPTPPPTAPTPPPSTPNPNPNPNPPEPSVPGATRDISPDEALSIIKAVHDGGGYNLGSGSSREYRIDFFWAALAAVHYGHPRYNPRGGDPGWCGKDAGGGRPPSDDVMVRCSSRDAWDVIPGAGSNGYHFGLDYIGKLPGNQNVYPPSRSSLPR
jgi:hypothetical protein